jgi:ZIP family zinc transporter
MEIIIFSGLAGILGTGIGGLIGIFLGKKSTKIVSSVLTFASGIMVSIAMFDLIPEAYLISGSWITAGGIVLGVSLIAILNFIMDKKEKKINTHTTLEELHHETKLIEQENERQGALSLVKAGLIMLIAIALHNIPEGMAIGASGIIDYKLGITLAILLAIHNIPEGMAIAVPLVAGGVKRFKTVILIIMAGAITMLGGLIGFVLGGISEITLALSLGFAGGAMLYVTFGEILPQAILMQKGRLPAVFSVFGIIVGFLLSTLI